MPRSGYTGQEYLGEAYRMIGNLAKAEEHLGMLKKICLIPCAEIGELGAQDR